MDPDKTLHEVHVAGMSLKLRSSHDEATVNELINVVNDKVNDALAAGQNISFQNALLLASLHIAEDLVLLKRTAFSQMQNLEDRTQDILSDLESSPISRIQLDN